MEISIFRDSAILVVIFFFPGKRVKQNVHLVYMLQIVKMILKRDHTSVNGFLFTRINVITAGV